MIIIITVVVLFSLVLTLSMCRVSSTADAQMEANIRKMMREKQAESEKEDTDAG